MSPTESGALASSCRARPDLTDGAVTGNEVGRVHAKCGNWSIPGSGWSGSRLVPEGGEVLKGGRGTWQIVTVPG